MQNLVVDCPTSAQGDVLADLGSRRGRIHGADGLREFSRPQSVAAQKFALPMDLLSFTRKERDMKPRPRKAGSIQNHRSGTRQRQPTITPPSSITLNLRSGS